MGLFNSPKEWLHLGKALGLSPYRPTAGYSHGLSFRQVKRSLGTPADHEAPSFDHWFYGRWPCGSTPGAGVEVVLLTFTVGSGSSQTTYTGVIARVDPPLFLGIGIHRQPLLKIFARPAIKTGISEIDERIYLEGFDPARVVDFLAPESEQGREMLNRIIANIESLHVSDSIVEFASTGYELNIDRVRWQLDSVTYIATTLAAWRKHLPSTDGELYQHAEWRRFADEHGFKFDAERMTLYGQLQGSHLKVALETEAQEIRTSVNVRFPHPVPIAFSVRRTSTPSFLQGLFGQDIKVGDEPFDDLYLVTGHPEEAVRQLLAKPALTQAMTYVGALTSEVQLNHLQLFFRFKGPTTNVEVLRSICETARITSASFFGEVEKLGPYR